MALQNPWVTYLDRSYKSIKASIIARIKVITPEITDLSESNIFVIIAGLFAGLIEQLNYYIDQVAREMFITTARRYSSMIKLTRLIDYRVRANIGATVDLKIVALDSGGLPVALTADYSFNSGVIVNTAGGIPFVILKKSTIFEGTSSVVVQARQGVLTTGSNLGTTTSSPDQQFILPDGYRHDSLQIVINSISWEFRNTFAFSGPLDKHFIVQVNEAKQCYVVFGDGVNGAIPTTGQTVLGTFYVCLGTAGNLEANTINSFNTSPTLPSGVTSFSVTNELPSVGGLGVEDLERIRKNAPLSIRTLNRAVTLQDYRDLALLVPGVSKASVQFNNQLKKVDIYVSPDGGGTAPGALLSDIEDYFSDKKMISTIVQAVAAGETKIKITMSVTAKFRRDITDTQNDIIAALKEEFGFNNSKVNKSIRKSDIIALVDNLDKVDFLSLDVLTSKPYPRIRIGSNQLENNSIITVTPLSIEKASWRIAVINSTTARVFRISEAGNESSDGDVTIHATTQTQTDYTSQDGSIQLAIWGTFNIQDEWVFTSYPYNADIVIDDFTIPTFNEENLSLNMNEQLIIS